MLKHKKLYALLMAGIMTALTISPAYATDVTLTPSNPSGDITLYANVESYYELELPADITFEEVTDGSGNGTMYYSASYGCNVYGKLLGQKVTLSPELHSAAGDTPGTYHVSMNPVERDSEGNVRLDSENNPIVDTTKDPLAVTVQQGVYEWLPSETAETDAESYQRIIKFTAEGEGHEDKMAQGVLTTDAPATGDTSYRGTLTFYVSCDDLD